MVERIATVRGATPGGGHGLAGTIKYVAATVAVGASDADGSTYVFFEIPSNARIAGISKLSWDDLGASTSATIDIGLRSGTSSGAAYVTADPDALNDGLDADAAASSAAVIKAHTNYGKRAWEFVNGLTEDPKGLLTVYASVVDAALSSGTGSITCEIYYTID